MGPHMTAALLPVVAAVTSLHETLPWSLVIAAQHGLWGTLSLYTNFMCDSGHRLTVSAANFYRSALHSLRENIECNTRMILRLPLTRLLVPIIPDTSPCYVGTHSSVNSSKDECQRLPVHPMDPRKRHRLRITRGGYPTRYHDLIVGG